MRRKTPSTAARSKGDKVELSAFDAEAVLASPGIQHFHFTGQAAFGNVAGELRSEKINLARSAHDLTRVSGDRNADGIADFVIELQGLYSLQVTDLLP